MVVAGKWQRREINLRFVLINLPKLALFWGGGTQTGRHRLELRQGFFGKVAMPRVLEQRGRETAEKTQARLGRFLSQLPLSVCSALRKGNQKYPECRSSALGLKKNNI